MQNQHKLLPEKVQSDDDGLIKQITGILYSSNGRLTPSQIDSARRLAARILPESDQHLAYSEHFERNMRETLERMPRDIRRAILAVIAWASKHPDPLALMAAQDFATAYKFLPARIVVPFAYSDRKLPVDEHHGLFPLVQPGANRKNATDLRIYPNMLETPDYSLASVVNREVDAIFVGSGLGSSVGVARYMQHFPNHVVVCLERGPYVSSREIAAMSPERAMSRLFKAAGMLNAFDFNLRRGITGTPLFMCEAVGGSSIIHNADYLRPPTRDYALANWPDGLDVANRYMAEVADEFQIRPIEERVMSPMARMLLKISRESGLNLEGWLTITEISAIETGYIRECEGYGRCNSGCPVDNKMHPGNTIWDRLLGAHPNNLILAPNQQVTKLVGLKSGRISGVQAIHHNPITGQAQEEYELKLAPQGKVFLGAGPFGTPKLLANSGLLSYGLAPHYGGMHIHPIAEVIVQIKRELILQIMSGHPMANVVWSRNGRPQSVVIQVDLPAINGKPCVGHIETALTPGPIMGLASPGLVGAGLGRLLSQEMNDTLGIIGVMYAESELSKGRVLSRSEHSPLFTYHQHPLDLANMHRLVHMAMLIAKQGGITDMRVNTVGPWLTHSRSDLADMGFTHASEIDQVMASLTSGKTHLLQFGSHAGQTALRVVEDMLTGRIRGVSNLFGLCIATNADVGTHPSWTIKAVAKRRVDMVAQQRLE